MQKFLLFFLLVVVQNLNTLAHEHHDHNHDHSQYKSKQSKQNSHDFSSDHFVGVLPECIVEAHKVCGGCGGDKPLALTTPNPNGCVCTKEYAPVCSNDKTFPNKCVAKCSGSSSWVNGPCKKHSSLSSQLSSLSSPFSGVSCPTLIRNMCKNCISVAKPSSLATSVSCLAHCVHSGIGKLKEKGCLIQPSKNPSLPMTDVRKSPPSPPFVQHDCRKTINDLCSTCFKTKDTHSPDFSCLRTCLSSEKNKKVMNEKGCRHRRRQLRNGRHLFQGQRINPIKMCFFQNYDKFSPKCRSMIYQLKKINDQQRNDSSHWGFSKRKMIYCMIGVSVFIFLLFLLIICRRRYLARAAARNRADRTVRGVVLGQPVILSDASAGTLAGISLKNNPADENSDVTLTKNVQVTLF